MDVIIRSREFHRLVDRLLGSAGLLSRSLLIHVEFDT